MATAKVLLGMLVLCAGSTSALGQLSQTKPKVDDPILATPPSHEIDLAIDSGWVSHSGIGGAQVVYSTIVYAPQSPWLRLAFDELTLSGDASFDNASVLRITSLEDGQVHELTSESAQLWHLTSAYMNGDALLVELVASAGTGASRLVMTSATAGDIPVSDRSICGSTDDRALSTDNRQGRHSVGCTSWLINDLNSMFLTAGHCGTASGDVMYFNVPLSDSDGSWNFPGTSDQYPVENTSIQGVNGGVGNDWGYYGVNINSATGKTPYQAYNLRYVLAPSAPSSGTPTIRITGYGTVDPPVSETWDGVQKTHTGPYKGLSGTAVRYHTDTTGGNSGSAVFNESTGQAIGVHTHGGCSTSTSSYNSGTAIQNSGLQSALTNPLGVCKSGKGAVGGNLYAFGDAANNFGTCSTSTGAFGKVSEVGAKIEGLAADWNTGLLFAIDAKRVLYSVNPSTGAIVTLGTVTGTNSTINGLAYDPRTPTLYGWIGSNGQLVKINTSTLAISTIGTARGGTIGAIDWDTTNSQLFGLNDSSGTKLVRISTTDGALTIIGTLGSGINDCNGLAYRASDNAFYTINAGNEQVLRVNRSTGAATTVGASGGLFGASFGMTALNVKPPCAPDFNEDGFLTGDDFDLYNAAFELGDPSADFNGDGFVTGDDFDLYVAAFEEGC